MALLKVAVIVYTKHVWYYKGNLNFFQDGLESLNYSVWKQIKYFSHKN